MSGHCRITPDGSPSGLVSELAGEFAPAIGRIETLVGVCTISRSGGPAVAVKIGDLVGPSDVIETSAGGRLNIRFSDGTTFTLSDNARMALKDYLADEASAIFDISRGTFSFIAGKMAEAGRLCIQTPFASIRARRNGGGTGMLSLVSLFFAVFEEAQAGPSDVAFLDDGKITSKDWGQFGVVELLVKATQEHHLLDDPGETIVIRVSGSSVSVDSVTNSIAQMAQYQAAQQEALHTFTVGLQGQGPTGNGGSGSSTPPPPEFIPPPQNINFVPNIPPPFVPPPPGPGTTQQNSGSFDPPLVLPPPPPPPPAPGLIVELPHDTGNPTPDITTGTLSSPGISAGPPTFVWSNGVLTSGDQTNLATASTLTFTGPNPNDFTFHIPDQAVDFLAAGETLTVTYNVTLAGGGTEQAIITVFGTQDLPKLEADVSGPHTTAERPSDLNDSALDQTPLKTLTFTDVDLNDTHTVSRSVFSATWSGGATLPSGLSTVLESALILTPHDSTGTGAGSVDFQFSAADKNFDFLAEGETLTVTYNVTVTDNFGASSTQQVTVTITGSEDAPVITSGAQSGSVTEDADGAVGENTETHHQSGAVTFTDVDLSDLETSSIANTQVSATLANGYDLTTAQRTALINAFTIDTATHSPTDGTGSIAWHYDIADSDLDFLGANDVVTLTYTVQVDDGHGGIKTQDVVITVQGTEDKPVITPAEQTGTVIEIGDGVAGENTDIHHQSGTIDFTDVDLSDIETSSIANTQVSATLAHGYVLTTAQHDALVNAFTIDDATHSSTDGSGTVGWHYDIADSDLDFLGAHDVVTLTFTVQVDDGNGGIKTQDVVITVHGTEDAPVITSDPQSGSATEIGDNLTGENVDIHHSSGSVTFTDVDLSDSETSSFTLKQFSPVLAHSYVLTTAQHDALVNAFTIGAATHSSVDGTGTIAWHYDIADSALDFLGANDVVTLTYTVKTDDGNGGTASQDVVITVHGTEDAPVITSSTQSGSATEIGDGVSGENVDIHHSSGSVTFTDVDLSDSETSTFALTQFSPTLAHGYVLTSAQHDALVNAFTIGAATHSSVDGTGTIAWHYDIADSALDFLGANDVVTLTYTVTTNDGNGGTASQDVTITVHGTEDKPVITSGAQSGSATEIGDGVSGENVDIHHSSGTITFTDVDLSDSETSSSTLKTLSTTLANSYTLTTAQHDALVNAFTVDAAMHSSVTGNGSIGWHYDIADSALDFLGANDVVTMTFTVTSNDGNGGTASQDVVITVHGTEDKPAITATSNSFSELAGTNNPNTDSVSGTISFTDVDASDRPTASAPFDHYSYIAADGATALTLTAGQQTALEQALVIAPAGGNTNNGSATWTYSVADKALDFLAQDETLTLTYTATVNDHNGGVVTQPITVTIHGTNDAPVIKLDGAYSLDQFLTQDYGAWVEQGNNTNGAVNGSPLNGEFQLVHDSKPGAGADAFQIKLTDLDAESDVPDTLTRTFNLVNAGTTAKVEFDYRRDIPSGQSNDTFDVYISVNGGAPSYFNIGATGNGSFVDPSYLHFSFDVSSATTINTISVQFSVGDNVDDGDVVYVDNIKLSYATPAGSTQTINYAENSAVGILSPQITDADHNAVIQSATLTLTNHQANDLLSVTGTLPAGISASSYNALTGVLTLTGTGSLADYQTALSHIIFSNTSDNPNTTDRTLTVTVNDGLANSNTVTETIHVTAINDAPTATADHVVTNFGNNSAFQIPDWALIANDTDPDNTLTQLSITGVSNQSSGTATHGAGATTVTFTDTGGTSGGSFDYTLSDGGTIPSTAHVTVNDVAGTTLNGTSGNDIFIAKAGGSTMNGAGGTTGGNDVFIGNTGADIMNGGSGNDTFVFKATTDSFSGAGHFDTINNFTHGSDLLDFTAIANATHVQQTAVAAAGLVDANSISWFVDTANNQTIVYVNTTGVANTVSMEVHLAGANINLAGSDILHHS